MKVRIEMRDSDSGESKVKTRTVKDPAEVLLWLNIEMFRVGRRNYTVNLKKVYDIDQDVLIVRGAS